MPKTILGAITWGFFFFYFTLKSLSRKINDYLFIQRKKLCQAYCIQNYMLNLCSRCQSRNDQFYILLKNHIYSRNYLTKTEIYCVYAIDRLWNISNWSFRSKLSIASLIFFLTPTTFGDKMLSKWTHSFKHVFIVSNSIIKHC